MHAIWSCKLTRSLGPYCRLHGSNILALGIVALKKWVDDFAFFQYPQTQNTMPAAYDDSLVDILSLAELLGWPWKPSKTKDFAKTFRYLGFTWDLESKRVSIPTDKQARYVAKLAPWVRGAKFTRKEAEGILGMLVYCSLAVPEGRSHLVTISKFTSSFSYTSSSFAQHTPGKLVLDDINYWQQILANRGCGSHLSRPPALVDYKCWVDASTSYGAGVVFGDEWDAWRLCDGWNINNRRIGWAEMIAIEFGLSQRII
jgi:hypothetical protein